jgi:hypothetical protein
VFAPCCSALVRRRYTRRQHDYIGNAEQWHLYLGIDARLICDSIGACRNSVGDVGARARLLAFVSKIPKIRATRCHADTNVY